MAAPSDAARPSAVPSSSECPLTPLGFTHLGALAFEVGGDLGAAVAGGDAQSGATRIALGLDVGAPAGKKPGNASLALVGYPHARRPTAAVCEVEVGASVDQHPDHVGLAVAGCTTERRPAVVLVVEVDAPEAVLRHGAYPNYPNYHHRVDDEKHAPKPRSELRNNTY